MYFIITVNVYQSLYRWTTYFYVVDYKPMENVFHMILEQLYSIIFDIVT